MKNENQVFIDTYLERQIFDITLFIFYCLFFIVIELFFIRKKKDKVSFFLSGPPANSSKMNYVRKMIMYQELVEIYGNNKLKKYLKL